VAPRQNAVGRVIGCLVIFIIVFTIGSIVVSVAAPLVVTGMIARVVGDNMGVFEGFLPTQVSGEVPQINLTLAPVLEMAIATPTPPEPGFAREILAFGSEGTGPGRFDDTRSVAVDADGNIYTAEYSDRRVQKFGPDGEYRTGCGDEHRGQPCRRDICCQHRKNLEI